MSFQSIIFSKEHLINPFEMTCTGAKISIEDQKINIIALSILVGVLTAGVGGVIFFYCLSAKYKLDKLKEIELVDDFAASFLHPYISGQISKETDPQDRRPMMDLIQEQLPKFNSLTNSEVEEIALNAFFEKTALGLYVHLKWSYKNLNIYPESPEFIYLINALTEALPREFPNRKISAQEVKQKATEALDAVNKERTAAVIEEYNFIMPDKHANYYDEKLERLTKLGQNFLV